VLLLAGAVVCGAAARPAWAERAVRMTLADGTAVTLVRAHPIEEAPHEYRYLPANLSIARRSDGAQEFSFLLYRKTEGGDIEGGIMHLLLRWGLSEDQEAELQKALRREVDSLGMVMGAASVGPFEDGSSWEITSRGAVGSILRRAHVSAGHIPSSPGAKFAMSFRFEARDAARMSEALHSKRGPWGEKIRFRFTVGGGSSEREGPDWVLESDLGTLIPRVGG
jgi:hypothetical protein